MKSSKKLGVQGKLPKSLEGGNNYKRRIKHFLFNDNYNNNNMNDFIDFNDNYLSYGIILRNRFVEETLNIC